jgi:hypothetical protein
MMNKVILSSVFYLNVLILAAVCGAEDNACFCLQHNLSQNWLYNCRLKKSSPNDYYLSVYCYDNDKKKDSKIFTTDKQDASDFFKNKTPIKEWSFIEAGQTGCNRCEDDFLDSDNPIKGDDKQKKEGGQ